MVVVENHTHALLKRARVELKTTPDMKSLLQSASMLEGVDLSAFVLGAAAEKARKVLTDHAQIALFLTQGTTACTEESL